MAKLIAASTSILQNISGLLFAPKRKGQGLFFTCKKIKPVSFSLINVSRKSVSQNLLYGVLLLVVTSCSVYTSHTTKSKAFKESTQSLNVSVSAPIIRN